MSRTIVSTCRIDKINPHPGADRLDLAVVGGWQCCVQKDKYKVGDLITYIPPDSVLPIELAEKLGVTHLLSKGRIIPIRLRNEPSFGLVIDPVGNEGDNVASILGITKYEYPVDLNDKESMPSEPYFTTYTDIENLRNFPTIFEDGEEVIVAEKIHGTNCRLGYIYSDNYVWKKVSGGRSVQRKDVPGSVYWYPWSLPQISWLKDMLASTYSGCGQFIMFGEVYGTQKKMKYGIPGKLGFRLFDILVEGRYLDWDETFSIAKKCGVETVPVLYRGPFSLAKIAELSKGMSTIEGANHIREGVIVRPVKERFNEKIGRCILKYVSDDFLVGGYDGSGE
jgi:RNA ligase (TIGR02306 family)